MLLQGRHCRPCCRLFTTVTFRPLFCRQRGGLPPGPTGRPPLPTQPTAAPAAAADVGTEVAREERDAKHWILRVALGNAVRARPRSTFLHDFANLTHVCGFPVEKLMSFRSPEAIEHIGAQIVRSILCHALVQPLGSLGIRSDISFLPMLPQWARSSDP